MEPSHARPELITFEDSPKCATQMVLAEPDPGKQREGQRAVLEVSQWSVKITVVIIIARLIP